MCLIDRLSGHLLYSTVVAFSVDLSSAIHNFNAGQVVTGTSSMYRLDVAGNRR